MQGWTATLDLDCSRSGPRTVTRHNHCGPLRVLKSLYPEGDAICHNVLVHPPGGLVGGDQLDIRLQLGDGAHGLITTPGASRFYRSEGAPATQTLHARIGAGARLEWLPQEALAYNGCLAVNEARFELAAGAELMAWDITALGLPAAGQPFERGRFQQHLEIPGVWLERGCIDAADTRLLHSPLGLAGQRCIATLVFASGEPMAAPRIEQALDLARQHIEAADELRRQAGATTPNPRVIVVRVLAPLVEPAMTLLRRIRAGWREQLWQLPATAPRIWTT